MRRLLLIVLVVSVADAATASAAGPVLAATLHSTSYAVRPMMQVPASVEGIRLASTDTIDRYVEVLRREAASSLRAGVPALAAQDTPRPSGPKIGTAAKTAIWAAAVVIGTVWAYETFSKTRGTR